MRIFSSLSIAFLLSLSSFAQPGIVHEFGKPFPSEMKMEKYDKDPAADAVYLYERGDVYFEAIENRIWIVKEYYAKIKVFNSLKFDGTIGIPFRVGNSIGERINSLEAITHNEGTIDRLSIENVFSSHYQGRWHIKTFAFPNLKDGSILEYRYKLASPYHFAFEDWEFQSGYPKVYSELHAKINANYTYRKTLIGNLKLDVESSTWQKKCFFVDGFVNAADCEVIHLAMSDIPAFIEEDFMLSKKNYASRISFDLIKYINIYGETTIYSRTWKYIDENFEKENLIHKQLNKKNFFKNKVPAEIVKIENTLERAKKVFSFFQNHFTWNDYLFRIDQDIELKNAFTNKTGSVDEINLSLLNSLLGLGYKAHIMLIATRDKGLPSDLHPNFYDYNYLVVRLEIDNKVYLLDATDKFMPFGFLPFRALNYHGRVFNYNGVSFWQDTRVYQPSVHQINVIAKLESDGTLQGKVNERLTNYDARNRRATLSNLSLPNYILKKEKIFNNNIITNLEVYHQFDNEAPLVERFDIQIDNKSLEDKIIVNPFLYNFFNQNPLTLNERSYPINFGYPRTYIYQISMELPDNYEVLEIPKSKSYFLIDNSMEIRFSVEKNENKMDLIFVMKVNGIEYPTESYEGIKDLFSHSIDIQKNSLIILKKK